MYYMPGPDVTAADLADAHWSLAVDHVPFVILSWCGGNNPASIIPGIVAGKYDTDINDFAHAVKTQLSPYGRTIIRPFWEFNYTGSEWNDVNYGGNAATFVAAWQHFVNIFRADGVTNVKWDWNPNRTAGQSQDPTAYYPGSGYVDWIGIDAYPKHQWLTLQQLVTTSGGGAGFDWYDTFKTYGKPLMVGETGIQPENAYSGGQTRATWWNDALTELEGPLSAIRAIEYFDSSQSTNWTYAAPGTDSGDSAAQALAAAISVASNCFLNVLAANCNGGPPPPPPPAITISSPAGGSTLRGTVNVTMSVSGAVAKVELLINNTVVDTASASPYTYSWNTKSYKNGSYSLLAEAFDSSGSEYSSSPVTVRVHHRFSSVPLAPRP